MLINLSFLHIVNKGLSWNKARLKCFSKLVKGVIKNRSVNLTLLATSMTEDTSKQSEYRKAQRFFEKFQMPLLELGAFIVSQIPKQKRGWVLSMDRTNWKFGKTHINILTVGIIVKGVAVPIAWRVLPQTTKRGNSNTQHRIEMMRKALKLYKQRWGIEQLFSHLKKRGFNLEDTHLRSSEKLERLFGVVAMSFLLTFGWGLILQERTKLTAHEKRKSIFRLGLESLLELFNAEPLRKPLASEPPPEKGKRLEVGQIIVV